MMRLNLRCCHSIHTALRDFGRSRGREPAALSAGQGELRYACGEPHLDHAVQSWLMSVVGGDPTRFVRLELLPPLFHGRGAAKLDPLLCELGLTRRYLT